MSDNIFDSIKAVELTEWLDFAGVDYRDSITDNILIRTCPECGNDNHKVRFSKGKRIGFCFVCEAKYNQFNFAHRHLGVSTADTFRHFEEFLGGRYIRPVAQIQKAAVVETAGEWKLPDSFPLPTDKGNTHPFLKDRGITNETQRLFGLRWCRSGAFPYLSEKGMRDMHFDDRIIIPVCDIEGHIQTFQGRATWQVDEEVGEKRYLFPPGLPGSARFIYGSHLVRGKEHLVLGEGPFDGMAIHQAICDHPDFANAGAGASFGLNIGSGSEDGNDQLGVIERLKRMGLKRVTLLWDAEPRAYQMALKACLLIGTRDIETYIGILPPGKDPNEVETKVVRDAVTNAKRVTRGNYAALSLSPPFQSR